MTPGGPLYKYIEFCRNKETLWHKLQSGHWDWLGVHPKGQYVLGRPRQGRMSSSVSLKVVREGVEEGQHGVRWQEWAGVTDTEPNTDWLTEEEQAMRRFKELVDYYENPERCPVLARVWRVENKQIVDERFIAQTPPPNYQ